MPKRFCLRISFQVAKIIFIILLDRKTIVSCVQKIFSSLNYVTCILLTWILRFVKGYIISNQIILVNFHSRLLFIWNGFSFKAFLWKAEFHSSWKWSSGNISSSRIVELLKYDIYMKVHSGHNLTSYIILMNGNADKYTCLLSHFSHSTL